MRRGGRSPELRRRLCVTLLCSGAALAACMHAPPRGALTESDRLVTLCDTPPFDVIELRYLGSGGFLLRHRDDALLTAPFYSNPGVLRVGLGLTIAPDEERIASLLPSAQDLRGVRAILVGHAHYDHAMDLPYIVAERTPDARVYGSQTLSHVLAPALPETRRIVLNDRAASADHTGQWIPIADSSFHILALESEHGPHLGKWLKLFKGRFEEDLDALPRSACGWKEGQTFAYLIDVRRPDGSVAFRIHYQDASSNPPLGFPPDLVAPLDAPVDVAILSVSGFAGVDEYPQGILERLRPRHAVLGHWEDFFRDPRKAPKVVRGTRLNLFFQRMKSALPPRSGWTLPVRDVTLRFRICGSTMSVGEERS